MQILVSCYVIMDISQLLNVSQLAKNAKVTKIYVYKMYAYIPQMSLPQALYCVLYFEITIF